MSKRIFAIVAGFTFGLFASGWAFGEEVWTERHELPEHTVDLIETVVEEVSTIEIRFDEQFFASLDFIWDPGTERLTHQPPEWFNQVIYQDCDGLTHATLWGLGELTPLDVIITDDKSALPPTATVYTTPDEIHIAVHRGRTGDAAMRGMGRYRARW